MNSDDLLPLDMDSLIEGKWNFTDKILDFKLMFLSIIKSKKVGELVILQSPEIHKLNKTKYDDLVINYEFNGCIIIIDETTLSLLLLEMSSSMRGLEYTILMKSDALALMMV